MVFILFLIACLPKIESFLIFYSNDLVTMEDLQKKIEKGSVYIFGLSRNWILNNLSATIVIIQVTAFIFFLRASTFKADAEGDWRHTWECSIDEMLCLKDWSQN